MQAVDLKLSFDDILDAVKESSRGRWFLDEFEARARKGDMGSILAAITKLESVVSGMGSSGGGAESALLAKAKSAIANAKREIASLDVSKQVFSDEAQLFAKLAELAKTSFNPSVAAPAINDGVARALKLVDEIDSDLNGFVRPSNVVQLPVSGEPQKYFEKHAEVFERPVTVAQAAPVAAPNPPSAKSTEPEVSKGAKLVINRVGAKPIDKHSETKTEVLSPVDAAPKNAAPIPVAEMPKIEVTRVVAPEVVPAPQSVAAASSDAPRVVIIRRKPEDTLQVPLVDQPAA